MATQTIVVPTQQYLTFQVAGEEYAIGIDRVREIIECTAITRVPKLPSFIRGVINLRGTVVPTLDLAVKFGLPESPLTRTTCIVVLDLTSNGETATMGLIADSVNQVLELPASEVEAVPSFGTPVDTSYLLGMVRQGAKFALILNVDRVLSLEELQQVSGVAQVAEDEVATPAQAEEDSHGSSSSPDCSGDPSDH